jgi:hypothetical protein
LGVPVRDQGTERRGATGGHGCGSEARGELGTGRERENLGLGEVEVGVEVLTVGPIELWWLIVGDRGGGHLLCRSRGRRNSEKGEDERD